MNNFLAWLGAALVVVLGALFAVPHFVDWNGYRGVLEEEASRVLGREVRVGGAVNVRLLPIPYLSFERLRVADPGSFSGEPLFRAESVTMWLAVPPLLRGVLEANQVEVRRPEIRIAVDRDGVTNWSRVRFDKGELPFVPADVALRAVSITDGRISLDTGSGGEITRLDGIDGSLSGEAFDGPYKFSGSAKWDGSLREVKLATARPDADGGLRFKTTVRNPANGNSYVVDGRLVDIAGRPTLGGELAARINLAGSGLIVAAEAAKVAPATAPGERPALDLKGRLEGNLLQMRLAELVASFENIGQPQLIEGEATASWGESSALAVKLGSKWLDVDRLAGTSGAAQPVSTALAVADTFLSALATGGRVDARLGVDQISIGGDTVSGLDVSMRHEPGAEPRVTVRASLPGGSNLDLVGAIARRDGGSQLSGPVMIGGSSLQRLLAWATRSEETSRSFPDGPFSAQGQLALAAGAVALTEARGEMAGAPLRGSIAVEQGPRRKVRIALEGKRVDTAWLWPGNEGIDFSALLPAHGAGRDNPAAAGGGWHAAKDTDISIRLQAGRLIDGARILEDVAADVALEGGSLAITRLAFSGPGRLAVELEGKVIRDQPRPAGELRGVVSAPTAEAVRLLSELTALDSSHPEAATLIGALAPLDLAATIALAAPGKGAFDLVFDGLGGGGRLTGGLNLDVLGSGWRHAPTTASLALYDASISGLLARTAAPLGNRAAPGTAGGPGTLRIDIAGVPSIGMLTVASVASEELTFALDGRSKLTAGGWLDIEGEAEVTARDGRVPFGLAGLVASSAAATPISGRLGIARREGALTLRPHALTLAGTRVSGEARVARGSGEARIEADLSLDAAPVAGLLAILTEPAPQGAASAKTDGGPASLWPERAFANPLLDGLTGRVRLNIGALELAPGLGVRNAVLEAALEPKRITVSRLEGAAAGGTLNASGVIEKSAAGAEISGNLSLEGARIEALGGNAARRARGPASLKLGFSGQALSPRGLIAVLKGKGEATLGGAEIDGLTPEAIGRAAEAVLAGRAGTAGDGLVATIRNGLAEGRLPLGPSAIPITIVDGALRVAATAIETKDGRTTIETTIDLGTLQLDSQWLIEAKATMPARGAREAGLWPAVQVVYVGPLGAIAGIEPQVTAAAFERELTVRRMELEVDELERLRRIDEERVRQERERQRQIEEERARAAASDPAAWAPSAAPVPPAGAAPAPAMPTPPGAAVESAPLPPVAEPAKPPAASGGSPRPQQARPQVRRTPSAAETTLQGLMPPGVQ